MTLKIHEATCEDTDALASLLEILFRQESEFEPNRSRQMTALKEILADSSLGTVMVAKRDDECIGMALILYTISTALGGRVGILEDMVVREAERGAGVGRRLIGEALHRAESDGCLRITLLADADNQGAHRFYERTGFCRSTMVPFRRSLTVG